MTIDAAVAAEKAAAKKVAAEQRRLEEMRGELARLDREIAAADPDARGFEDLVRQREMARAKVEALESREAEAQRAADDAAEGVDRARRAIEEERIAKVRAAAKALDGDITREVREFRTHVGRRIRELRGLLEQIPPQFSGGLRLDTSGCFWAQADEASAYVYATAAFSPGR